MWTYGLDGDVEVAVETRPVTDSEESLAVWMANCDAWRSQLEARIGCGLGLEWFDPDGAVGTDPWRAPKVLVYEDGAS